MAGNVVPENRPGGLLRGEAGGSAKGILLVLLALVACVGYFYFFTDMLRPKEETPSQPLVYTSEVKKPLPERPGAGAEMEPAPAVSSASPPATDVKTVPEGGVTQVTPEPPPAAPKAPAPPKAVAAKPKSESEKTAATAAVKEPAKKLVKESSEKKKAPPASVTGVAVTAAKSADKKGGKAPSSGEASSSPVKTAAVNKPNPSEKDGGKFSVQVGTYVMKETMLADKAKLEKAGFNAAVISGPKKSEPMNRLLVAEFSSYSSAKSELDRLGKVAKGAFMVQERGRFAVYAGSYFSRDRAVEEQKRLRGKGFVPLIKNSEVPVATYTLISGSFATREDAEQQAGRLRKLGFKPIPLRLAKQ